MARYFSDVHATKESQLYGTAAEVEDSEEILRLRAAVMDYQNDYNLQIQLAAALGRQLRYREAITVLTGAIALEPNNPLAYRRRAPRYYSTLQFDAAYADYSFCAEKTPDSLDVLYRLGILCVAMRRYGEAKHCLARCIRLTEGDGEMQVAAIYWYLAAYLRCHEDGEENLGALAYHHGMEVGHHFAYRTGVELLCGLLSPGEALAVIDDSVDDLDHSMILYGVYLYHSVRGEEEAAGQAMERLLARDYYWAGFAYVAAYADHHGMPPAPEAHPPLAVPEGLYAFFQRNPQAAVAFSGGADSSYLLYAAKASGCRVKAYYVQSRFQPAFELADARRLADEQGVTLMVIPLDVLAEAAVRDNPPDRCYHCKRAIFGRIAAAAAADGYPLLLDGTNASDDAGDRPGMRALAELSVASPLREAGVTKAQLREYSHRAGLFTWDKPAYACLATRIPTGIPIEPAALEAVEAGEAALAALGFFDFRLRVTGEGSAMLQLREEQFPLLARRLREVNAALAEYFPAMTLDLVPRG